jgi:hypothetical protein
MIFGWPTFKTGKQKYTTLITVGTVPKSNRKIIERDKIDISNAQIHDRAFSFLVTGTSIPRTIDFVQ